MSRFVAYISGPDDTLSSAVLADLEALIVRTYPSEGFKVGVEIEPGDATFSVVDITPVETAVDPLAQAHIDAIAQAQAPVDPAVVQPAPVEPSVSTADLGPVVPVDGAPVE